MLMNSILFNLKKSSVIGITFHASPDGDSLGSSLALMLGLRKLNKKVYIISKDKLPEVYGFLPESHIINGITTTTTAGTECVIALDCGNSERLNGEFDINGKEYTLLNIDHHLSNNLYGDVNYVDTEASAVGEIIYKILKALEIEIDKDIATCLYTSIVTDCGSFSYSNTTSVTHSIVGELILTGIDFPEIHRLIYRNKEFYKVKFLGKVIDNMYLEFNSKLCIMEITKKMIDEFDYDITDTSDVISLGIEISGIEVAALFKEKDNCVKVSLRSKDKVDVRKIAENFGGGGHTRAAGFMVTGPIEEVKKLVLKHIEKELM
jgi:bifunctional oligoribonuclease and PAP phosphatase NrnA